MSITKLKMQKLISHPEDGHNRDGFSIFGSKKLSKNYELFARYDQISSNILSGESKCMEL